MDFARQRVSSIKETEFPEAPNWLQGGQNFRQNRADRSFPKLCTSTRT